MTEAYHYAQKIVKLHVNAGENDVLIFSGTGMTSALAKLQRILGLKIPEQAKNYCSYAKGELYKCKSEQNDIRPVVFLTHTEHHSNHTSWFETIADVVVLEPKFSKHFLSIHPVVAFIPLDALVRLLKGTTV